MSENDTLGFGGFTPPPGPPGKPRRRRLRTFFSTLAGRVLAIVVAFLVIGVIIAVAASGGPGTRVAKAPAATSQPASPPLGTIQPASSPPDTAQDLTGPLGTTFTLTEQNTDTGVQDSYEITAVRVLDPARGSDEFSTADAGKRLAGVEFRITGTGGYAHDDANAVASVQGSDGQVYQPDFTSLAAGTNFSSGDFSVTDGRTQTGWVTFQLPRGVTISSVQWQSDPYGDQPPATWQR